MFGVAYLNLFMLHVCMYVCLFLLFLYFFSCFICPKYYGYLQSDVSMYDVNSDNINVFSD